MLQIILALSVTLVAMIWDIKTREIPNTISFAFVVAGFVFCISRHGFISAIFILLLTLMGALILYQTRAFGGGDIKMFWGIFLMFELSSAWSIFTWIMLISLPFIFYLWLKKSDYKFPFGVPIFFGTLLALIQQGGW